MQLQGKYDNTDNTDHTDKMALYSISFYFLYASLRRKVTRCVCHP